MCFLENVCVCVRARVCVISWSATLLKTGKRYRFHLWQINEVHFEVVQVQFYS